MADNLLQNKIKDTFGLNKSYVKKNSRDVIEEIESGIKITEKIEANIQIKNQNLESSVEENLNSLNFLTDSFDNGEKSEKLVENTDNTNDEIKKSCKRFKEDKSNSKRFVCDCTFSTDSPASFRAHCTAKYLSGPSLKCELCEYKTECTSALKKHTRSALLHFFSKCAKYSYQCISQANLKEHAQIYHDNGNFEFSCSKCNFTSFTLYKLKKHVALNSHYGSSELVESRSTQYDCKTCGYICKSASNFSNHLKIHMVKDRKLYICTQCRHSTHRKHDLKRHMTRIHKATFEEVRKAVLNDQESRSEVEMKCEIYIKEEPSEMENGEKEIGEMADKIREKGSEIINEEGV